MIRIIDTFLRDASNQFRVVQSGREASAAEIRSGISALGVSLRNEGAAEGTRVVILLPRSPETVIANLAVVAIGSVFSNVDCLWPVDRVRKTLAQIRPALLVVSDATLALAREAAPPESKIIKISDGLRVSTNPAETIELGNPIPTDAICIVNTSGSTGTPKSVAVSHLGLWSFLDWGLDEFQLRSDDHFGNVSPLEFDLYLFELFACLQTGAALFLLDRTLTSQPDRFWADVCKSDISVIFWVPTIMVNLCNAGVNLREASSLRLVLFAGEAFPRKFLNHWVQNLPETRFFNLYGPIEITIDCTFMEIIGTTEDHIPVPIGRPMPYCRVYLLDESDNLCETDQVGEICVAGPALALGYVADSTLTASSFVENPTKPGFIERIYRTGDFGHRGTDGLLYFDGRRDSQVKHLGNRIELGEIETAALTIEGVTNALATYEWSRNRIWLVCETKDSDKLATGWVRNYLRRQLPKYMIPTKIAFMAEFPVNFNGKKDALRIRAHLGLDG